MATYKMNANGSFIISMDYV